MIIDKRKFQMYVGRAPEGDDLDRCNCTEVGKPGHTMCGWCAIHNQPRYACAVLHLGKNFMMQEEVEQ